MQFSPVFGHPDVGRVRVDDVVRVSDAVRHGRRPAPGVRRDAGVELVGVRQAGRLDLPAAAVGHVSGRRGAPEHRPLRRRPQRKRLPKPHPQPEVRDPSRSLYYYNTSRDITFSAIRLFFAD